MCKLGDAMGVVVGSNNASKVLYEVVERMCKLGDAMEVVVGSSNASQVL